MSYGIVVSQAARRQLDSLFDYIAAEGSRDAALRFTQAIVDQIDKLADFPNRGVLRDDILPGLRTIGFRRRVTIAFVVEERAVMVLGIFYGGQDFETLLHDD